MSEGPWIETVSGTAVDLLTPQRDQIKLGDIAHSLARIPRFNGHTNRLSIWSVADHSILVMRVVRESISGAPSQLRLAALLRDAHQAYTGDISAPMKETILATITRRCDCYNLYQETVEAIRNSVFPEIINSIQEMIHLQFGLPWPLSDEWRHVIDVADKTALAIERRDLLPPGEREWEVTLPDAPDSLTTWISDLADSKETFLREVDNLFREFHGISGQNHA